MNVRRLARVAACVVLSSGLLVSCDNSPKAVDTNGPQYDAVVTTDSVVLRESDTSFVGLPTGLAIGPDGSFFISDGYANRVIRFDRSGTQQNRYGKHGAGPGEFKGPALLAVVADSLLVVDDMGRQAIAIFGVKDERYRRSVRRAGTPTWLQVSNDTVWLSAMNQAHEASVIRWAASEDTVSYIGPWPEVYRKAPRVTAVYGYSAAAPFRDRFVVGFAALQDLIVVDGRMNVTDTITLPPSRRRGVPADVALRLQEASTNEEYAQLLSTLAAVHQIDPGHLATVHFDVTNDEGRVRAIGYANVIDSVGTVVCRDVELPFAPDSRPFLAFRGDTVFSVEQRVLDGERSLTFVRGRRIDRNACIPR